MDEVVARLRTLPTTAFLVLRGDRTAFDYGDTTSPAYLASVRKSVMSVLFGRSVADGAISLDATLEELGIDDIGGLLPVERQARVRDLLTARSGVCHAASTPTGLEAGAPERGSKKPGEHFFYNNWDFNVLGTIFERCTSRRVFNACAADVAEPLGFQDFDPGRQRVLGRADRSVHLAHHFSLSGRDLGRIGRAMLRGGRWGDRQVVPAEWVAESTTEHVTHRRRGADGLRLPLVASADPAEGLLPGDGQLGAIPAGHPARAHRRSGSRGRGRRPAVRGRAPAGGPGSGGRGAGRRGRTERPGRRGDAARFHGARPVGAEGARFMTAGCGSCGCRPKEQAFLRRVARPRGESWRRSMG
jgi:CubicO group peptidase (beta-lactamase class C family)